ncbi:MAG: hypothetical protein V9G20_01375 [Candidatus Promineifilaceae bacterium]
MTRYFLQKEVEAGTACIAYGFDHALGYFYQEEHPGQKRLVVDVSSLWDGLTGVQLAQRLVGGEENLIAIIEDQAEPPHGLPRERLNRMMLDLPF